MTIALIAVLATTVGLVLWLLICVAQLRERIDELAIELLSQRAMLLDLDGIEDRS